MDGSQLDRLIVDALLKTNGGKELIKTSTNELSVLIKAINHNNRKIQQPSLPSNLDEAANRQAALEQPYKWEEEQDGSFGVTPLFVMSNIRSAFKAGAEWMAEQGVSIDANVIKYDDGLGLVMSEEDVLSGNFKLNDKVIVQIRKKQ